MGLPGLVICRPSIGGQPHHYRKETIVAKILRKQINKLSARIRDYEATVARISMDKSAGNPRAYRKPGSFKK